MTLYDSIPAEVFVELVVEKRIVWEPLLSEELVKTGRCDILKPLFDLGYAMSPNLATIAVQHHYVTTVVSTLLTYKMVSWTEKLTLLSNQLNKIQFVEFGLYESKVIHSEVTLFRIALNLLRRNNSSSLSTLLSTFTPFLLYLSSAEIMEELFAHFTLFNYESSIVFFEKCPHFCEKRYVALFFGFPNKCIRPEVVRAFQEKFELRLCPEEENRRNYHDGKPIRCEYIYKDETNGERRKEEVVLTPRVAAQAPPIPPPSLSPVAPPTVSLYLGLY